MELRRIAFALAMLIGVAHAQFIGYVSSQTIAPTQVFTAQAANGASSALQNVGQAAHFLNYCNTGFAGTVSIEASPDGTFASPTVLASATYGQAATTDSACHILQAGGYFQTVRARVSHYVSGSVNAWYTAIASPISFAPSSFGSNGPTAPITCDHSSTLSLPASSSGGLVGLAGTSIYICQIYISFNAATSAGDITVGTSASACPASVTLWSMHITASTPQALQIGGPGGSFITAPGGLNFCIGTGAITAGAAVSYSYAQF